MVACCLTQSHANRLQVAESGSKYKRVLRVCDACAHLVVDEEAGQQHGQREDLRAVLSGLRRNGAQCNARCTGQRWQLGMRLTQALARHSLRLCSESTRVAMCPTCVNNTRTVSRHV